MMGQYLHTQSFGVDKEKNMVQDAPPPPCVNNYECPCGHNGVPCEQECKAVWKNLGPSDLESGKTCTEANNWANKNFNAYNDDPTDADVADFIAMPKDGADYINAKGCYGQQNQQNGKTFMCV